MVAEKSSDSTKDTPLPPEPRRQESSAELDSFVSNLRRSAADRLGKPENASAPRDASNEFFKYYDVKDGSSMQSLLGTKGQVAGIRRLTDGSHELAMFASVDDAKRNKPSAKLHMAYSSTGDESTESRKVYDAKGDVTTSLRTTRDNKTNALTFDVMRGDTEQKAKFEGDKFTALEVKANGKSIKFKFDESGKITGFDSEVPVPKAKEKEFIDDANATLRSLAEENKLKQKIEVTNLPGVTVSVTRDADGKPRKIEESGGTTFTRIGEDKYRLEGTNKTFNGDFFRQPDGSYGFLSGASEVTRNPLKGEITSSPPNAFGSTPLVPAADGKLVMKDSGAVVQRDAKGAVIAVAAENYRATVKQDKVEVVRGDRVEAVKASDMKLREDGAIEHRQDGKLVSVEKPDGSKIAAINSRDGASAYRIHDRNGVISEHHYGKDGGLVAIKEQGQLLPNGQVDFKSIMYKLQGGGAGGNDVFVVAKDASGKQAVGDKFYGSKKLDVETGTVTSTDGKTGERRVDETDGSTKVHTPGQPVKDILVTPTGSTVQRDENGKTLSVHNKDGSSKTFAYVDGKLAKVEMHGTPAEKGRVETIEPKDGAEVSVNKDGELTVRSDNSYVVHRADGAKLSFDRQKGTSEIKFAGGESITIAGIDQSGRPNKIFYGSKDGNYSASSDGKTWNDYTNDGKLVPNTSRREVVTVDFDRGSFTKISADGKIDERGFDDSRKQWEIAGANKAPILTYEKQNDGTVRRTSLKDGRENEMAIERPDGTKLVFGHQVLEGQKPGPDGVSVIPPLLIERSSAHIPGSAERGKITYSEITAPDGRKAAVVQGYHDERGMHHARQADGSYHSSDGNIFYGHVSTIGDALERHTKVQQTIKGLEDKVSTVRELADLNGKKLTLLESGAALVHGSDGHLERSVSRNGYVQKFEWNGVDALGKSGQISKVTLGDGEKVWTTNNGIYWNTPGANGMTDTQAGIWRVDERTGDQYFIGRGGGEQRNDVATGEWSKSVGAEDFQARMNNILNIKGSTYVWASRADDLHAELKGLSADQMRIAKDFMSYYHQFNLQDYVSNTWGKDSSDGQRLNGLITQKEHESVRADAEKRAITIRADVTELDEWFGRSNRKIYKEIRDTTANLSNQELFNLKDRFQDRYGDSLENTVRQSKSWAAAPEVHKAAMELYMDKGKEGRTKEEEAHLMDLALKHFDQSANFRLTRLELFKEFSSEGRASASAREHFMSTGGNSKLEAGLVKPIERSKGGNYEYNNHWYNSKDNAGRLMAHAQDFMKDGKLGVKTMLEDENWGTSINADNIKKILTDMTPKEKEKFAMGLELFRGHGGDFGAMPEAQAKAMLQQVREKFSDPVKGKEAEDALRYFMDIRSKTRDLHWSSKDAHELAYLQTALGSTLGLDTDQHRGLLTHSGREKIMAAVEKMDRETFTKLTSNNNLEHMQRRQFKASFGEENEKGKAATELFDRKMTLARQLRGLPLTVNDREAVEGFGKSALTEAQIKQLVPASKPEEFKQFLAGREIANRLDAMPLREREAALHALKGSPDKQEDYKALEAFRSKLHEAVQANVKRPVLEALTDNEHFFGNDRKEMFDHLLGMTESERRNYASNKDGFRDKMQGAVKTLVGEGDRYEAAMMLLRQVEAQPERPASDNVAFKLMSAHVTGAGGRQNGADILTQAFSGPDKEALRAKLAPNNPGFDSALSADLKKACETTFGKSPENWDTFVKPIIQNGYLPAATMKELYSYTDSEGQSHFQSTQALKTILGMDKDGLAHLSKTELKEFAALFSGEKERQLLTRVLESGAVKDEDKLRAIVTGVLPVEEMDALLRKASIDERRSIADEYHRKYGGHLLTDLKDASKAIDHAQLERDLRVSNWTAYDNWDHTRAAVAKSDNWGESFQWSSARDMMMRKQDELSRSVTDAAVAQRKLDPKEIDFLVDQVLQDRKHFARSKAELAETVTEAAIATTAVILTAATGGAASPLMIAAFATAAAAGSTAYTKLAQGNDAEVSELTKTFCRKLLTAGVQAIPPAKIGAALGLGEKIAAKTAATVVESAAVSTISAESKQQLEKLVATRLAKNFSEQIMSNAWRADKFVAQEITADALKSGLITTTEAAAALQKAILTTLEQTVQREGRTLAGLAANEARSLAVSQLTVVAGGAINYAGQTAFGDRKFSSGDLLDELGRSSISGLVGHMAMRPSARFQPLSAAGNAGKFFGEGLTTTAATYGGSTASGTIVEALHGRAYSGHDLNNGAFIAAFQHGAGGGARLTSNIRRSFGENASQAATPERVAGNPERPAGNPARVAVNPERVSTAERVPVPGSERLATQSAPQDSKNTAAFPPGKEFQDTVTGIRIKIEGQHAIPEHIVESFLKAAEKIPDRPTELAFSHDPTDTASAGQAGLRVRVNTAQMDGKSADVLYFHETGHVVDFEGYRRATSPGDRQKFQEAMSADILKPEMARTLGELYSLTPEKAKELQAFLVQTSNTDVFHAIDPAMYRLSRNEIFAEGYRLYQHKEQSFRETGKVKTYAEVAAEHPIAGDENRAKLMAHMEGTFKHLEESVFKPMEVERQKRVAAAQAAERTGGAHGASNRESLTLMAEKFSERANREAAIPELSRKLERDLGAEHKSEYLKTRAELFNALKQGPDPKLGEQGQLDWLNAAHKKTEALLRTTEGADLGDGVAALHMSVEAKLRGLGQKVESKFRLDAGEHAPESRVDASVLAHSLKTTANYTVGEDSTYHVNLSGLRPGIYHDHKQQEEFRVAARAYADSLKDRFPHETIDWKLTVPHNMTENDLNMINGIFYQEVVKKHNTDTTKLTRAAEKPASSSTSEANKPKADVGPIKLPGLQSESKMDAATAPTMSLRTKSNFMVGEDSTYNVNLNGLRPGISHDYNQQSEFRAAAKAYASSLKARLPHEVISWKLDVPKNMSDEDVSVINGIFHEEVIKKNNTDTTTLRKSNEETVLRINPNAHPESKMDTRPVPPSKEVMERVTDELTATLKEAKVNNPFLPKTTWMRPFELPQVGFRWQEGNDAAFIRSDEGGMIKIGSDLARDPALAQKLMRHEATHMQTFQFTRVADYIELQNAGRPIPQTDTNRRIGDYVKQLGPFEKINIVRDAQAMRPEIHSSGKKSFEFQQAAQGWLAELKSPSTPQAREDAKQLFMGRYVDYLFCAEEVRATALGEADPKQNEIMRKIAEAKDDHEAKEQIVEFLKYRMNRFEYPEGINPDSFRELKQPPARPSIKVLDQMDKLQR